MGLFDLPTGELELNLKPKRSNCKRNGWTSVAFTDRLYREEIASCVEVWSKDYKVTGARYNGKTIQIPKKYHWEVRNKEEIFGKFKTRAEAVEELNERRLASRRDASVKVGRLVFVEELA